MTAKLIYSTGSNRHGGPLLYHLTDDDIRNERDADNSIVTRCQRRLVNFNQEIGAINWAVQDPAISAPCSRCGTAEDYEAVNAEIRERVRRREEARQAASDQARDLSARKLIVWQDILLPQIVQALEEVGANVTINRTTVEFTIEVDGMLFASKFVKPNTDFGYDVSSLKVVEGTRWK